jgi:hypothetical protein
MEVECWGKWYWKTVKQLNVMWGEGKGVRMGMKDIQLHKQGMEVEVEGSN